jgi:site-specific recombinase XerD
LKAIWRALPDRCRKSIGQTGARARRAHLYAPLSPRHHATLLLDAGLDIRKLQDLLGHPHITTTQIYDKRRRSTSESASHDVPI